jgi:hypothetical protein
LIASRARRAIRFQTARPVDTGVGRFAVSVALAAIVARLVRHAADVIATVNVARGDTLAGSVAAGSRRGGRVGRASRGRAVLALVPVGACSGLARTRGSTRILQGDFALLLRVGSVVRHCRALTE